MTRAIQNENRYSYRRSYTETKRGERHLALPEEFLKKIIAVTGTEYVLLDPFGKEPYSHDEYPLDFSAVMPEAVVIPGCEEEVAAVITECNSYRIPVTSRGGGTGLSGGCVPSERGIVLSLQRLNKLVEIDPMSRMITVEAGMTLNQLYSEVEKVGLFFPPHPGDEGAFVGGVVATNAGGARAVKYGTVKRFVCGLTVVLPDGSRTALGGRLYKTSSGYSLLDLFIGSEGTLGVITKVTMSLIPPPRYSVTLVTPFNDTSDAIRAVPAILNSGSIPSAVEFVEHSTLRCVEHKTEKSWPVSSGTASLMLILDGDSEDSVLENAEKIAETLEKSGAGETFIAEQASQQADILGKRSMIYDALREATVELFDICVPVSQIAEHVHFVHSLEQKYGCALPTYGHAADGNVHTHFLRAKLEDGLFGEELPNWRDVHAKVRNEIYRDALSRGGVISGEHGIGKVKKEFFAETMDSAALDLMRKIKSAFDPNGIMNPGNVI